MFRKSGSGLWSWLAVGAIVSGSAFAANVVPTAKKAAPQTVPAATTVAPVAPTAQAPTTSVEAVTAPAEGKIYGLLELRPSWTTSAGETHTENILEGGYQFDKNVRLTYVQWFTTNIYNPKKEISGLQLSAEDGFARLRVNNIWQSADKTTGLSYQARLFAPTKAVRRDAGMLTALHNRLTLAHKFSSLLSMDLSVGPTLHVYSKPGLAAKANPVFDNFTILNADIKLASNVLVSFPFYFINTRSRTFAGAANSASWSHQLIFWPEIGWDVTPNQTIGASYYTGNLVKADLSGTNISSAFNEGVAQLLWRVTL